ncbi:hypothetical protein GCK32_018206 [Trichostrongylus colubriformis]|uniref:Uncharacterized protein n=1 Tax=Trichostrongylus colubriformis TaxID=6319 RepID=A0AAN8ISF4_TRICO
MRERKGGWEGRQANDIITHIYEHLRDGDDVNLASESEEFGAANATNKDMRGAQTRTPALMPRSRTSKESTKKTSASQAEGGQACILCTIAVLLIMLVATSTTTVIVVLHWSGTIKWIPQLNDLLYE